MKYLNILIIALIIITAPIILIADTEFKPGEKFSPLLTTGGIYLDQLAELAYSSVHFHEENYEINSDFILLSTRIDESCGFQGIACEHKETGKIVIAFAGTQAGMDPLDLLADVGILLVGVKQLKIKTKELINAIFNLNNDNYGLYEIHRIENEWMSLFDHTAKQANFRNNRTLRSQVSTAKSFVDEFISKTTAKNKNFKFTDAILVGHSLGGFIAQVIGNENSNFVHTFNAPGAYAYGDLINDKNIYNHMRKNDGIGRFGIHLGKNIIYPNTKMYLAIMPPVYFVKNHTIEFFYKDLRKGMSGNYSRKEYR